MIDLELATNVNKDQPFLNKSKKLKMTGFIFPFFMENGRVAEISKDYFGHDLCTKIFNT